MEITNEEILNSRQPLQMLSSMRLPVKVSLQIANLAVKLNEPYGVATEVKNKLINQYGQEQKGGEVAVIMPNDMLNRPVTPDWEKFLVEYNELLAQKVELNIEKVQLPPEIDGKPLQIEPSILMALGKFIDVVE